MSDDGKVLYFDCDCKSPEHTLRLEYVYDEEDSHWSGLYVQVFMRKLPLWRRLMNAWLYVVHGKLSNYGHFETTIISDDRLPELREWLDTTAPSRQRTLAP